MFKIQVIALVALASFVSTGCKVYNFTGEGKVRVTDYDPNTQSIHYSHGGWFPGPYPSANFRAILDLELQADQSVLGKLELPSCVVEAEVDFEYFRELDMHIQSAPKKRQPEGYAIVDAGNEVITRVSGHGDEEIIRLQLGDHSSGELVFVHGSQVRLLVDKIIDELGTRCKEQEAIKVTFRESRENIGNDYIGGHFRRDLVVQFRGSQTLLTGENSWYVPVGDCRQNFFSEEVGIELQSLVQQIRFAPMEEFCTLGQPPIEPEKLETSYVGCISEPDFRHLLDVEITYADGSVRRGSLGCDGAFPLQRVLGVDPFISALDQWMRQQPARCVY